jgi:hypothetical protein
MIRTKRNKRRIEPAFPTPFFLVLGASVIASFAYLWLDQRTDVLGRRIARLEQERSRLEKDIHLERYNYYKLVYQAFPGSESQSLRDILLKNIAWLPRQQKSSNTTDQIEVSQLQSEKEKLKIEVKQLSEIRAIELKFTDTIFREFNERYGSSTPSNLIISYILGVISSLSAALFYPRLVLYIRFQRHRRKLASLQKPEIKQQESVT